MSTDSTSIPLTGPSSDVSDGKSEVPSENAAATLAEPVDLTVAEHGPYFIVGEKSTRGNQFALAAKFAETEQVRFAEDTGEFVRYNPNSGCWEAQRTATVKARLAEFVKQRADTDGASAFLPNRTNAFLGSVLELLKGFSLAGGTAGTGLIHVGNGMLDLTTVPATLKPFDPAYSSRQRCEIHYDASSTCPRFEKELLGPSLSASDIGLLQRFLGSTFLGHNAAQRFLILQGGAALGKSTLMTIVERILGVANVAHLRTEHLPGRFETHAYLGKKLLTAKDVPPDFLSRRGAQMIKALVGDDLIEAEAKFGGKTRLRGNFTIVVTSNSRLTVPLQDDELAWRRRLLVVRFEGQPAPKRVANFADVLLKEEASGILTWLIAGAQNHLRELEATGDYALTTEQKGRIDDLLRESRSVEIFVAENIRAQRKADVSVEDLKQAYFDFCSARGWAGVGTRQFESALGDLMQRHHRVVRRNDILRDDKCVRGFRHVSIRP